MGIAKQAIEKYEGKVIPFTCTRSVLVGDVVPLGSSMISIAINSGLSGEIISVETEKVWTINATTADAISIGDTLYWNDTTKALTTTAASNIKAGKAMSSKAATTVGTVDIKINV